MIAPIGRVFLREVRSILGRKSYIFLFIVWPLVYGLIIGSLYAEKVVTDMPLVIVDQDRSAVSRVLARYLDASRSFAVRYRVATVDELRGLLLSQHAVAGVVIPAGTERAVKRREPAVVTAFVNGANLLTANLALADLRTVVGTVSAGIKTVVLEKGGMPRQRALALQSPVTVDLTKLYNPGYNYQNYLAPGIWLAILHQIIMLFGALLIAVELEKGTFSELNRISGGSAFVVLVGKFLPYLILSFLLLETVFRLFFPLFGIPVKGNIPLAMSFSIVFSLAVLSMGFFLSAFFGTRNDAIKGALFLAAPAFLLSGYTWPLSSMPPVLHAFAWCIPLTSYLQGIRKICQHGAGAAYLGGETLTLALITVVCAGAGLWFLSRRLREAGHVS